MLNKPEPKFNAGQRVEIKHPCAIGLLGKVGIGTLESRDFGQPPVWMYSIWTDDGQRFTIGEHDLVAA